MYALHVCATCEKGHGRLKFLHACMWQIARFKDNELAQLRVMERDHYRQETEKTRREVCICVRAGSGEKEVPI